MQTFTNHCAASTQHILEDNTVYVDLSKLVPHPWGAGGEDQLLSKVFERRRGLRRMTALKFGRAWKKHKFYTCLIDMSPTVYTRYSTTVQMCISEINDESRLKYCKCYL